MGCCRLRLRSATVTSEAILQKPGNNDQETTSIPARVGWSSRRRGGSRPPPLRGGEQDSSPAPASLGHNRWPCDKGITWFGYSVRAANPWIYFCHALGFVGWIHVFLFSQISSISTRTTTRHQDTRPTRHYTNKSQSQSRDENIPNYRSYTSWNTFTVFLAGEKITLSKIVPPLYLRIRFGASEYAMPLKKYNCDISPHFNLQLILHFRCCLYEPMVDGRGLTFLSDHSIMKSLLYKVMIYMKRRHSPGWY